MCEREKRQTDGWETHREEMIEKRREYTKRGIGERKERGEEVRERDRERQIKMKVSSLE